MKPLRNRGNLQAWAGSGDYTSLTSRDSIEILLSQHTGVDLGAPVDGATAVTTTPTLRWAPYPGATEYQVNVWDYTGDVKGTQIVDEIVSDTDNGDAVEYTISSSLTSATKYLWQISQRRTEAPVEPEQPISVEISGGTTLEQNGTRQLSASVSNSTQGVTWSSSNDAIATVNSSGLVTYVSGAADATVTITATSVGDGTKSDDHVLTIIEESTYVAQDNQEGDELFLNEFYTATQGQHLPTLASSGDLPATGTSIDPGNVKDLDQYMINGELWFFDGHPDTWAWVNMGAPWKDKTGWNNGAVDLSVHDPVGVTKEFIDGEWRVTRFDMQKVTFDGYYEDNQGVLHELWDGNVCAGYLPESWGNLTKCAYINLKQNFMVGDIPDTLQSESLLEWLSLGGNEGDLNLQQETENNDDYRGIRDGKEFEERNKFTGPLPVTLPSGLEIIEIRRQYLSGGLPTEWGTHTSLDGIYLNIQKSKGANKFGGTLPSEWGGNGLNPRALYLAGSNPIFGEYGRDPHYDGEHNFTGSIPQTWQDNWSNVVVFSVRSNTLEGTMPDFVLSQNQRVLQYANCGFTSPNDGFVFPPSIFANGNNANLTYVNVDSNNLSGALRQTIDPITKPYSRDYHGTVSILRLPGYGITGDLPDWIDGMTGLIQFDFSNNEFSSGWPVKLSESINMRLMTMNNMRDGTPIALPDITWDAFSMYEIHAGNNAYEGEIPASWSSLQSSEVRGTWIIGLNNNLLSGLVPAWLADMKALHNLYINENKFTYCDILPHYEAIKANLIANEAVRGARFYIHDQKPFPVAQTTYNHSVGDTVTIDLSGIDYANNVYQWIDPDGNNLSNGGNISGATSHTLTITNAQTSDSGDYQLRITNSDLTGFNSANFTDLDESLSEKITINVT